MKFIKCVRCPNRCLAIRSALFLIFRSFEIGKWLQSFFFEVAVDSCSCRSGVTYLSFSLLWRSSMDLRVGISQMKNRGSQEQTISIVASFQ